MNADPPVWLPDLMRLGDFGGDWNEYIETVYLQFHTDFVLSTRTFRGRPVHTQRDPIYDRKEAGFWHLVSEGRIEEERLPDLPRCERIRWPRAMLAAAEVVCWANERHGKTNVLIALPDFSYVVILADRPRYFLLKTAYCLDSSRRRDEMRREREAWLRNQRRL